MWIEKSIIRLNLSELKINLDRRAFARGLVLVNPDNTPTSPIKLPATYKMLAPSGGLMQEVGGDGQLHFTTTQTVTLQAHQGVILLTASA